MVFGSFLVNNLFCNSKAMVEIEEGVESIEWGDIIAEDGNYTMYRSFTYRGVNYSTFDDVYTFCEGAKETDIGKILRIWGTDKDRKVRILWFFRPRDISNFLKDARPSWKELFLASGEGKGLSNDIPLEAIIGKCNVICTSRDPRNVSRAKSDIAKADYFFSHVFDVGTMRLSDKLPDKIDSVKVDRLLKWDKDKLKANAQRPRVDSPKETRPLKKVRFSDADTVHILEPKVEFLDRAVGDEEVKEVRGTSSERSKMPADDQWFIKLPWEQKIEVAHERRRLVTMINLDPSYTSSDVQDIIFSAFKLKVEAKIIPCRSFSGPSYGQALVIFNSMDDANFVVSELHKKCLVDGDGRPIDAFKTNLIKPPTTNYFPGHLALELYGKKKRTSKANTVSTSHCAQENTSESQFAAEWISLHDRCDLWCKSLHELQAKDRALCLKKHQSLESKGNTESSKATPEHETVKWQHNV
ncbi:protein ANTI-SILENCING 1-like isoform X2 [Silene latifolia]|uniref:protein ANTI-SILENCING 1-like isoform X2 n=2 Tax=Silene latifolia TaxID=37657 RepID=UPI003D776E47